MKIQITRIMNYRPSGLSDMIFNIRYKRNGKIRDKSDVILPEEDFEKLKEMGDLPIEIEISEDNEFSSLFKALQRN